MKTTILATALVILPSLASQVRAANFKNLDFEEADISAVDRRFPNAPTLEGDTASLALGWSISYQGLTLSKTEYNGPWFYPAASLLGPLVLNGGIGFKRIYPSAGDFSLFFAAYFTDHGNGIGNYDLTQTAVVPSDAKSIRFLNYFEGFKLFVDGAEIPLSYTRSTDPVFEPYSGSVVTGDISKYAGREVELKFETFITGNAPIGVRSGGVSYHAIDSISFSPDAVPEPSTIGLLGLSTGILLLRKNGKDRQM